MTKLFQQKAEILDDKKVQLAKMAEKPISTGTMKREGRGHTTGKKGTTTACLFGRLVACEPPFLSTASEIVLEMVPP